MLNHLYSVPGGERESRARPARRATKNPQHETDLDYFRRRSLEERRSAMAAADMQVRALHLELADRYTGLVAAIAEVEDKIG